MKLEKSGTYCLYVKIDSLLGEKVDYFNININTNVRATDFS